MWPLQKGTKRNFSKGSLFFLFVFPQVQRILRRRQSWTELEKLQAKEKRDKRNGRPFKEIAIITDERIVFQVRWSRARQNCMTSIPQDIFGKAPFSSTNMKYIRSVFTHQMGVFMFAFHIFMVQMAGNPSWRQGCNEIFSLMSPAGLDWYICQP